MKEEEQVSRQRKKHVKAAIGGKKDLYELWGNRL